MDQVMSNPIKESVDANGGKADMINECSHGAAVRIEVLVSLGQMKCLNEKEMPKKAKGVGLGLQKNMDFDQGALTSHHEQRVGESKVALPQKEMDDLDAEEIYKLVKRGKTRKILDSDMSEDEMDFEYAVKMKSSHPLRLTQGLRSYNEVEEKDKISCAMAFKRKY